jgi:murein DD-endopeptidase MepM/ murein hydrolase activator NlpD
VRKGEVLAEVGETGNASAPHLHFEVRRNDDPRDPLLFLP